MCGDNHARYFGRCDSASTLRRIHLCSVSGYQTTPYPSLLISMPIRTTCLSSLSQFLSSSWTIIISQSFKGSSIERLVVRLLRVRVLFVANQLYYSSERMRAVRRIMQIGGNALHGDRVWDDDTGISFERGESCQLSISIVRV